MGEVNTEQAVRSDLPATERLLVEGGDARIALAANGLNKYGCSAFPDPGLVALGSSTASGISGSAFVAADRLRRKLLLAMNDDAGAVVYKRELNLIRRELLRLCGVDNQHGVEAIFAASGTDAHLIAAQLVSGGESTPTLAIMVEAAESGSGVPAALGGRHFSTRSALGDEVVEDTPISDIDCFHGRVEVATVRIRRADGTPRTTGEVDAEFSAWASKAVAQEQRVLLVLTDVSKTGLIAPSPACAMNLYRSFPGKVDVLVDACQFRIATETLVAYLDQGFMVALTGSKFVSGPPFSGVLLVPSQAARRFRGWPLSRALSVYSSPGDWPDDWNTAGLPDNAINFGLLLRWEAALEELRAFRAVPAAAVQAFLQEFSFAVGSRLLHDPVFEPLPLLGLDRLPLAVAGWDCIQTIFPFLLLHPETRSPLSPEQTKRIYQLLQLDLTGCGEVSASAVMSLRCQLGQPVMCGVRNGSPMSALRLCVSARMIVEAAQGRAANADAVIEKALAALDKASLLVRSGRS